MRVGPVDVERASVVRACVCVCVWLGSMDASMCSRLTLFSLSPSTAAVVGCTAWVHVTHVAHMYARAHFSFRQVKTVANAASITVEPIPTFGAKVAFTPMVSGTAATYADVPHTKLLDAASRGWDLNKGCVLPNFAGESVPWYLQGSPQLGMESMVRVDSPPHVLCEKLTSKSYHVL